MINFLSICEAVSLRGGDHLLEHPADPGCAPYPSVFSTDELMGMKHGTGAIRLLLHQCMYGGRARKDTFLSETLDGLDIEAVLCDRRHQHAAYVAGQVDGAFESRELATNPSGLCRLMAELIVRTLLRFQSLSSGPTGCIRFQVECPRVSHWSTRVGPTRSAGVDILNEAAVKVEGAIVTKDQGGLYLHVDDGLVIFGILLSRGITCPLLPRHSGSFEGH